MSVHRFPCPTCEGPSRETEGMVCQVCGWDYSQGEKPAPGAMSTAHVVPVGDLIEHPADEDCVCGPTPEPIEKEDGAVHWIVTHHSLDGREAGEGPMTPTTPAAHEGERGEG